MEKKKNKKTKKERNPKERLMNYFKKALFLLAFNGLACGACLNLIIDYCFEGFVLLKLISATLLLVGNLWCLIGNFCRIFDLIKEIYSLVEKYDKLDQIHKNQVVDISEKLEKEACRSEDCMDGTLVVEWNKIKELFENTFKE